MFCTCHLVSFSLFSIVACFLQAEVPKGNPVAAYYADSVGYPAWTDRIKWNATINMAAYTRGENCFEKFENARDQLAAQGGGILYYPAGVYDFSEGPFDGPNGRGLMLKPGVVIRGETPNAAGRALDESFSLPTKFVFGFRRRSCAVDAGDRLTLVLENGEIRIHKRGKKSIRYEPASLILSFPVSDGGIGSTVKAFRRGYGRDVWKGKAKIRRTKEQIEITCELAVPDRDASSTASFDIAVRREGDRVTGIFTGTCRDRKTDGTVTGRFLTITPETPRDWNLIGLAPEPGKRISDVDDVGIVYVHLVGGVVYFGPDVAWGETWATAGSWKSAYVKKSWADRRPDGTHPWDPFAGGGKTVAGVADGRLVFGCLLEHAAVLNESVRMGRPDDREGFGEDGFYMHKFGARIAAYGNHVFIGDNRLPESSGRNFKYRQRTRRTFPSGGGAGMGFDPPRESVIFFDYNKTPGIEINKSLLGLTKSSPTGRAGKGFFAEDVVVVDNYVYSNGHRGFDVSGTWVTIARNHNERQMLKEGWDPERIGGWELTLDGHLETSPGGNGAISDNLSRAFDLSGKNVWVHRNMYNNLGSAPGNDGEGILCQAHGGSQVYSWAVTYNRHEKGHGKTSYIGGWDVDMAGALFGWNEIPGWIGSINVGKRSAVDLAFCGNRAGGGIKAMRGAQQGDRKGTLHAPEDVMLELYDGCAVKISWRDASDNEVGFRVDRRAQGGDWIAIAYRPPRIQGCEDNPQAWIDFCAPRGTELSYRVVAVTTSDDEKGSSNVVNMMLPRKDNP